MAKINRAACTYVGFASDVDDGKLFCVFVRDEAGRWRYIQSGPRASKIVNLNVVDLTTTALTHEILLEFDFLPISLLSLFPIPDSIEHHQH